MMRGKSGEKDGAPKPRAVEGTTNGISYTNYDMK